MPRPPLLPLMDWKSLFEAGKTFEEWLAEAEEQDNCRKMEAERAAIVLEPETKAALAAVSRRVHVTAIAEAWCGDVVRHAPVMACLADAAPNVDLRFISRAQSLDAFARFLTNGGEAIPKFVFFNDTFVECGNWGPLPHACRELIARGKACGDIPAAREKVGALYAADPDKRVVIEELMDLIDIASCTSP